MFPPIGEMLGTNAFSCSDVDRTAQGALSQIKSCFCLNMPMEYFGQPCLAAMVQTFNILGI